MPGATDSARVRIGDKITIFTRGKRGIWTAEFHHGGQHRHRSLKTANQKIARQRALIMEASIVSGDYAEPRRAVTIADAIKQFLSAKRAESRASKTLVKYEGEVNIFAESLASHGICTLPQITPSAFDEYRVKRQKGHSAKTLHTSLLIVKTFIKWAVSRELMERNPLLVCKVSPPYIRPKTSPTLPQTNSILENSSGVRQTQYAMLAFTGIRAGELQHLRPQDVDLDAGWIHIRAHGDWQPKTRQARKIPIHPRLSVILKSIGTPTGAYFFRSAPSPQYPGGDHFIDIKTLNEDFQRAARLAGLPAGRKTEGFVLHSLRHFFETQTVDSSIPQFVIDAWMGHVGHETTGRIYYGLTDEKSQTFMAQVKF